MAKKAKARRANDAAMAIIRRTWGDLEVVEADHDLRVFIQPEDLKNAKRKDAGRCVFANACRRAFGSSHVLFFRSVAFVELATKDGIRRVERFILGQGMRDLIELFDKGEAVIPDAGFLLKSPSEGQTMEYQRKNRRLKEHRRRIRERDRIVGKATSKNGRQGEGRFSNEPLVKNFEVRNGTGAVHFVAEKK